MNRIRIFCISTEEEEKLTALVMASVEQDFDHQQIDYEENITDKFATENKRKIDFLKQTFSKDWIIKTTSAEISHFNWHQLDLAQIRRSLQTAQNNRRQLITTINPQLSG